MYGQHNIGPADFRALADTGCTKDHNEECVYPEAQRRTRKRKLEEREQKVEDQLARMEMMLRAATQQIPVMAQDQHPVQSVTTPQGTNHVDSSPVDSISLLVPQRQGPAPAVSAPHNPSDATERSQWHRSPKQACPSVEDNSIEVQVASMSGHGQVPVPIVSPNLPSPARRQPSTLNSAVAGYQGVLSSPSLDLELPAIFDSESTVPSPCEAGASGQLHAAPALTPASRHVDSPGISGSDWADRHLQQNSRAPADSDNLRDTINVQVPNRGQPQTLVTPPSTTAPDGPGIGVEIDADAPCDEVTPIYALSCVLPKPSIQFSMRSIVTYWFILCRIQKMSLANVAMTMVWP